jgi:hypothetical protein
VGREDLRCRQAGYRIVTFFAPGRGCALLAAEIVG